ncbi:putative serine esterase-domain-containing protein [Lipomyces orientalis]|uniref:Serine esterase-domain-containing protein n=1 Tax=Lipomyces orientalis TaxID=1233043 RepID=A0ACC3TIR5_9ASCO
MSDDHLFVLLHGLWGNKSHLYKARDELLKEYPDARILVAATYAGNLTYDGVSVCGEKVIAEIKERVREIKASDGVAIRKFSIAGYSLGGLVSRYVVGELYNSGFFDTVKPMNFTTFATPHLGACAEKPGFRRWAFNYYGRKWLSQSGRDMFLGKGGILPRLADPEGYYYAALTKFERLSLYANITNDRSVPFFTSFMSDRDPFTDLAKCRPQYVDGYEPIIVDLSKEMKILKTPIKRKWSRRDYIFFSVLFSIGPIIALAALTTITVSTQFSEQRVRQFHRSDQFPSRPVEMAETNGKNESGAELMQDVVEDLLDARGAEEEETGPIDDAMQYGSSNSSISAKITSTQRSRSSSVSSLTTVCSSLVEHRARNPDFGGDSVPEKALDLEDVQIRMCNNMNRLHWNKYAVQIHQSLHSHAAIINRKGELPEGDTVLGHWVERVVV